MHQFFECSNMRRYYRYHNATLCYISSLDRTDQMTKGKWQIL
jgi:hypothetical protein